VDQLSGIWAALISGTSLESKAAETALVIAVFVLLRRSAIHLLARERTAQAQYQIRKSVSYVAYGFGFIVIGRIWVTGFESLATYAGLVSAGLAIALQSPLANLAGWAFIVWRKPFVVGDRVEIGSHRGDVIDLRPFMFTLMEVGNWVDADQSTGRLIHVPNGQLFSQALANYTQAFHYIWNEVPVLVTFESDWRKAKTLLEHIAHRRGDVGEAAEHKLRDAAKSFMIFYTHLTPVVYTTVRDSGVLLTIRYLCEPRQRRPSEQSIWEDILTCFAAQSDVDLAYPTQRVYLNPREGKPGTRPPESRNELGVGSSAPERREPNRSTGQSPAPGVSKAPPEE